MLTLLFIQKNKRPVIAKMPLKKSQLRYRDCRENEQVYSIAMKSTVISLHHAKESSSLGVDVQREL